MPRYLRRDTHPLIQLLRLSRSSAKQYISSNVFSSLMVVIVSLGSSSLQPHCQVVHGHLPRDLRTHAPFVVRVTRGVGQRSVSTPLPVCATFAQNSARPSQHVISSSLAMIDLHTCGHSTSTQRHHGHLCTGASGAVRVLMHSMPARPCMPSRCNVSSATSRMSSLTPSTLARSKGFCNLVLSG